MDDVTQNDDCGTRDESNEDRHDIDPRARPVILAAEALKILRDYVPGSCAAPVMPKLRGCMDGLYLLINEMPPLARKLFLTLDMKVQVLTVRLGSRDSGALDAACEELIERVTQLGDVLMDALMRPEEEGAPRSNGGKDGR